MYSIGKFARMIGVTLKQKRLTFGYCRVSSIKKDDLERQVESVKAYRIAKGYSFNFTTYIVVFTNYWLYSVSNNVTKQVVKDACDAYKNSLEVGIKQQNFLHERMKVSVLILR